jgi:hypothetical protein
MYFGTVVWCQDPVDCHRPHGCGQWPSTPRVLGQLVTFFCAPSVDSHVEQHRHFLPASFAHNPLPFQQPLVTQGVPQYPMPTLHPRGAGPSGPPLPPGPQAHSLSDILSSGKGDLENILSHMGLSRMITLASSYKPNWPRI